jgi:hypothetical protein
VITGSAASSWRLARNRSESASVAIALRRSSGDPFSLICWSMCGGTMKHGRELIG